jgi:hypothetical protein
LTEGEIDVRKLEKVCSEIGEIFEREGLNLVEGYLVIRAWLNILETELRKEKILSSVQVLVDQLLALRPKEG